MLSWDNKQIFSSFLLDFIMMIYRVLLIKKAQERRFIV